MVMALLSSPAMAADKDGGQKINIRGNDKENYSRIVFDWGHSATDKKSQKLSVPPYTTQKNANSLVVTFSGDVELSAIGAPPQSLGRVTDYKVIAPNKIEISFSDNQDVRHFVMGDRLVVDIKGPVKKKSEPINLAARIETEAGDIEKAQEKKVLDAKISPSVIIDEVSPTKEPVGEKKKKKLTISLTSTTSVPLAVYERNGYLWVVQGKENIKIPPQILGEDADSLGRFEVVPSDASLSVFRMKIDSQFKKTATGGGLAWQIDVSDKQKSSPKPLEFKKISEQVGNQLQQSLLWPALSAHRMSEFTDPDTGDKILVGLVETAKDFTGKQQSFIDFKSLPSIIGLAVIPKIDNLKISPTEEGLVISAENGLNLATEQDIQTAKEDTAQEEPVSKTIPQVKSIYDFKNWQIGTKQDLSDNQRLIMSGLAPQTDSKRAESLISLAKLVLSFNYAPEAIGYLELAQSYVPEIDTNPEFMAVTAAAEALSWRPKEAFTKFSNASLNDIDELKYWKAFTLAGLDDWQQAAKILPSDMDVLTTYTEDIKVPLSLRLMEVALREGNVGKAKSILDILEPYRSDMDVPRAAAYDYLLGEFERQTGKVKEATALWKDLSTGPDDLYRAKSRFAATMMQLESKEITEDKAVDSLEGLRYAWRGDDLEVSINNNLAGIYLKKGEPVKALTLMDFAFSLNPKSELGKKIDADMHEVFKDLFSEKKIKDINPVDILILYNDFAKLIPAGVAGENLTRQLAERMVSADLLPRAIAILKKQLDSGLKGADGATVAMRLASLQNLDGKPDDTLLSLDKAETLLKDLPTEEVIARQNDIGLLRAKAYSLKGKPEEAFEALALLPQDDDSLHLRADIAWRGKKWQEAADSLEQLVQNRNMDLTQPLSDNDAELLLNWGVALYLADNRYVLANLRERYSDAMLGTTRAKKFDVVTRPRQGSLLADRETINSIIDETVIFNDFLKSFRSSEVKPTSKLGSPQNNRTVINSNPVNIPDELKNAPDLKTDEVLGD